MAKLLVLSRFVKEYEPKRLVEEARSLDLGVDLVKYGQIGLAVNKGEPLIDLGHDRKISDYDFVIPRAASKKGNSMVATKSAVLGEFNENQVLNGKSFSRFPLLGKIEQGLLLAKNGLPAASFAAFGSKLGWESFRADSPFVFPMIIKGRFGSHGRTVKLVNDWDQFERVFKSYQAGSVLVQPLIHIKQWYRTIVVGDQYLGCMRHRQKPMYGAVEGPLIKFNSQKMDRLKEISLKACQLVEADYAGLDIAWDEDAQDWVIIEINRTAQFKYFEKKTAVNVAKEIINYLGKK